MHALEAPARKKGAGDGGTTVRAPGTPDARASANGATTSISLATAQSIASTVMSVEPVHPNTRIEYRSAPGATPGPIVNDCSSVVGSYGPWKVAPVDNTPKPAIVPATWLPCPLQSSGFGSGCGTSLAGSVEAEL